MSWDHRKRIQTALWVDLFYVMRKSNERRGVYQVTYPENMLRMALNLSEEPQVYRVKVQDSVEVLLLTMGDVDDPDCGVYSSIHDLPEWIQNKIALLSMLSEKPPTENVPGVGRRIYRDVYWVYKD